MAQNIAEFDHVYPVAPDDLYTAVQTAVADGPYKKQAYDPFTKAATFKSRRSWASWSHAWQAQVRTDADGSRLHLSGATMNANQNAINTSNKRAAKVAADLFADVSRRCAAMG